MSRKRTRTSLDTGTRDLENVTACAWRRGAALEEIADGSVKINWIPVSR